MSDPKTVPVILDVDTGYDDALALLLALNSPRLDVLGITCVAGNQRLPQVVINTLKILDVVGRQVPVAAGMGRALIEPLRPPAALHGEDGMADLGLPDPSGAPIDAHAVDFLRQTLTDAREPVTLICLAPLTNIAVLLRMVPQLHEKIREIVVMSGTFADCGNTSPLAEFNARQDPEATAMVLESGLPVRLYPLDVFRQIHFDRAEIAQFRQSDSPSAQVAGRIMHYAVNYFQSATSLIGDAGTVATVIDPGQCEIGSYPVSVELTSPISRGATVIDRRPLSAQQRTTEWWQASTARIDVTTDLNTNYYRRLFARTVGATNLFGAAE